MANCPNINTEEWKDLVADVGELRAYSAFIENNYDIPTNIQVTEKLTPNQVQAAKDLKAFSEVKHNVIDDITSKINIYKDTDKQKVVGKLEETLEKLITASNDESVALIVNNAETIMRITQARIRKPKIDSKVLKQLGDYVGVFEEIASLIPAIEQSEFANKDHWSNRIKTLEGDIKDFRKFYLQRGPELVISKLAEHSTSVRSNYKHKFQQEYQSNHPRAEFKGSRKDWQKGRDAFVEDQLSENKEEIELRTEDYVREMLSRTPQDLSSFATWLYDPRSYDDQIIQVAVTMLDKADDTALVEFLDAKADLVTKVEKFEAGGKSGAITTNQKEKYKGIIEMVDGKETNYYAAALYNDVINEYESINRMKNDPSVTLEELHAAEAEFKSTYFKAEYQDESMYSFGDVKAHLQTQPLYRFAKEKYKNKQWNKLDSEHADYNPRLGKMANALIDFNKASDKISKYGKLGNRLPSIRKHDEEYMQEDGRIAFVKQSMKDAVKLNENDTEDGATETIDGVTKAMTDLKGNVVQKVNLPYRNEMELKDQSYDLVGMALANRHVSLNYREKAAIKEDLELVKDLMAERKVTQTQGENRLVKAIQKLGPDSEQELRDIEKKGLVSNSYKAYNSVLEDRLYGKGNATSPEIMGISVNKASSLLTRLSSHNFLIANYLGGTSNFLQGNVMNFLGAVGGEFFDKKNLAKGEVEYWKDIQNGSILSDIGSRVPKAKTNILMERFLGTSMDFEALSSAIVKDSRFKRMASMKSLHGINATAEHFIQGTLMHAVMDNVVINGKKLSEIYTVKNGKLIASEEVNEFEVSRRIKAVVADLQGNYDTNNKAMAQRYWYGKLAFFLRKWIIRGSLKRWRGASTSAFTKDFSEMLAKEPHLVHYSEELQSFKEGSYTSAIRFLYLQRDNIKSLQMQTMAKDWDSLTDMERANIRTSITEVALMMGALVSSWLLMGLADEDEDNEFLMSMAYLSRRMHGELMFYVPFNVNEVLRVMQTPSASMSILKLSSDTMTQLLSDAAHGDIEQFESGRHKGISKSGHYLNQLFNPFYKNWTDKNSEASLKWLMNAR